MLREGDILDPFDKFRKAGRLAKTVAHWGTFAVYAVRIAIVLNKILNFIG